MQGKNCKGLVSLIANGLASRTPFALSRRYFFVLFLRVLCVLGGEALVSGQLAHAMEVADTVFINGKIITVDERFTIAHALAIKGEGRSPLGPGLRIDRNGPQEDRREARCPWCGGIGVADEQKREPEVAPVNACIPGKGQCMTDQATQPQVDCLIGKALGVEPDGCFPTSQDVIQQRLTRPESAAKLHKIDLSAFPNITAYMTRMAARPAVQEAMKAEGLLKAA